jgi:hypothetical protein
MLCHRAEYSRIFVKQMDNSADVTHFFFAMKMCCMVTFYIFILMIPVFWNMTPCSIVDSYQRFYKICCFHLQDKRLNSGRKKLMFSRIYVRVTLDGVLDYWIY